LFIFLKLNSRKSMREVIDAFWRAALYCLHPRVIALSFLPLVIMCALGLGLGYFFWESAIDSVMHSMTQYAFLKTAVDWLEGMGLANFKAVVAPLIVLGLSMPLIVVGSLLIVSVLMTPAMVSLVAERRFNTLERKHGASFLFGALHSLGCTLVALIVLVASIVLWLIPPLFLVLPPLIWGWLTYKVLSFDALSSHASPGERKTVLHEHRVRLMVMGVVAGFLGAAPSLIWASSALLIPLAPVLLPLAMWIYTLVFAFSSLWFAHYCLAALEAYRSRTTSTFITAEADTLPPGADDPDVNEFLPELQSPAADASRPDASKPLDKI
jgi:hypothetical protein